MSERGSNRPVSDNQNLFRQSYSIKIENCKLHTWAEDVLKGKSPVGRTVDETAVLLRAPPPIYLTLLSRCIRRSPSTKQSPFIAGLFRARVSDSATRNAFSVDCCIDCLDATQSRDGQALTDAKLWDAWPTLPVVVDLQRPPGAAHQGSRSANDGGYVT